jgi:hypothetical protein
MDRGHGEECLQGRVTASSIVDVAGCLDAEVAGLVEVDDIQF